ncbi:MAG: hypothetical protein RRB13_14320 [bacterium]|nr:hypothetical protein [bacterium]
MKVKLHKLRQLIGLSLCAGLLWMPGLALADGPLMSPREIAAEAQRIEYKRFFEDQQNFFLTRPELVEILFLGIVELKGNPERAKYHIRAEVLGCPAGAPLITRCRVDQIRLERQRLGRVTYFEIPVNFTELKFKPQPSGDQRVEVAWQQETWDAPILNVDEFLSYLGAAAESPYYRIKPEVKQIVFNAVLQNHFDVMVDRRLVKDLLSLYKDIPQDERDRIYYRAFESDVTIVENLASLNFYLEAKAARLNNRIMPATSPKRPR